MNSYAEESQEWHDRIDVNNSPAGDQQSKMTGSRSAITSAESCPDLLDKFSRTRIRNSSGCDVGPTTGAGRPGSISTGTNHLPPPPLHQPLEKQDSAISLSADGADPCELCGREPQDEHICKCRNDVNATSGEIHEHLSPLKEQTFNNCLNKRRPSSIAASAITQQAPPIQQATPINVNLQKWLNTSPDTKLKPRLSRTVSDDKSSMAASYRGEPRLSSRLYTSTSTIGGQGRIGSRSPRSPCNVTSPRRGCAGGDAGSFSFSQASVRQINNKDEDVRLMSSARSGSFSSSSAVNRRSVANCSSPGHKYSPTPSLTSDIGHSAGLKPARRPLSQSNVSVKDQKILELMLARRSEQASQRDQRDMAYMQWEAERSRTHTAPATHYAASTSKGQGSMSTANSRRRQSAAPSAGVQQLRDEVNIRKSHGNDGRKAERPKTVCSNIETVPKCSCDMTAGEVCTKCNTPVRRERELQRRQYDRKLKEIERKKRQEEKKKQYEKEQEELSRKIKEQQDKVLERAKSSKNIHAQEQMLRTKVRNIKTKIRQEQIKEKLQSEKEEKEYMLSQIDEKHKHAEIKRQNIKKNSELDFRRSHSDLVDRMEKSKQRKEEIDSQMISYREDLHSYLHSQEQRAADSAKNQVKMKKMRASNSNLNKTETQKKNLARLMEQEKDWKAEVEADIALKDSRIKNHQIERSEKIASSREMARTSRLLRDQMKCHYSTNDLDKHYL